MRNQLKKNIKKQTNEIKFLQSFREWIMDGGDDSIYFGSLKAFGDGKYI
jgi:hypothetical protein